MDIGDGHVGAIRTPEVRRSGWLRSAACLLALCLMAYAQYRIRRDPNDVAGTLLLLVAAPVAALLLGRGDTPPAVSAGPVSAGRWASASSIVGMLAILGGATLLSCNWVRWFLVGWAILLVGVCLLSVGLWGFDPPAFTRRWRAGEIAALLAILALGTALRFYRYNDFPGPFSTHAIEEQQTGLGGYLIIAEGQRPWEFMLDHYLAALAIWLSSDPTFTTIRIPFTVFSALTVLPVHLLLRQLVGVPAALAGTFLFSVSSWNILYSRCAHNIFFTNFIVIIVLGLLVHFARTRRLAVLPWAGLLSGYTLYTYAGYRGTSLFALIFLGLVLAGDGLRLARASDETVRRRMRRAVFGDLAGIAVLLFTAAAVFSPVFLQLRADKGQPYHYFEAAQRSLANKTYYTENRDALVRQRVERIRQAARIFMHTGDAALTFNAPGEPMLDPLTATCFVGGLFIVALFPRRGFNAFWLFMFLALMLGGTVFVQNLDVRRLQGITVFVVIFAALFLDRLWAHVQSLPRTVFRWGVPIVVTVAATGTLWWNYNVYFHKMADNRVVREAFHNPYTALIRYGHENRRHRYLLLLSVVHRFFDRSYYYRDHYSWLIDRTMHGQDVQELSELLPPSALPLERGPLTVLIQKPYEGEAIGRLLAAVYPGTHCSDFPEPDNPRLLIVACDLPDHLTARAVTSNVEARYWLGPGPAGEPRLVRREPMIAYATLPPWCQIGPPGPPVCYAEWSGSFNVAVEGEYRFVTESRGATTIEVSIDDLPIGPDARHLTAGPHRIRATAHLPRQDDVGARLSWVHNGVTEVIPFYVVGGGQGPAGG
jgi:hypothetical protein